jgi:NADH dehydrogenase [ubiquinone] 1 alpha subcomplex assembly factor 1
MAFLFSLLAPLLFSFDRDAAGWRIVNDDVMGGRSTARLEPADGRLLWTGVISLENNGGFASIRSPLDDYDFSAHRGLRFRLKADGRRYAITAKTRRGFTPVIYLAYVDTKAGEWMDIEVPFGDLEGTVFAEPARLPALDPASVKEIGLMLYDKQAGPFRVELASVEVYGAP